MRAGLWRVVDWLAHLLHQPAMLGRRSCRDTRLGRVRLIPGSWLRWVCDRYDLAFGVTRQELRGESPVGFRCPHASITTGGTATLITALAWCGCVMTPVYRE